MAPQLLVPYMLTSITVSPFDEKLAEDRKVNRLEDSYLLWASVCQCKLLVRAQLILCTHYPPPASRLGNANRIFIQSSISATCCVLSSSEGSGYEIRYPVTRNAETIFRQQPNVRSIRNLHASGLRALRLIGSSFWPAYRLSTALQRNSQEKLADAAALLCASHCGHCAYFYLLNHTTWKGFGA